MARFSTEILERLYKKKSLPNEAAFQEDSTLNFFQVCFN